MASKALTLARKTASAVRRKAADERLQAGAASLVGGSAAAFVDKDGVRHIGETPLVTNLALGVALQVLTLLPFAKRMPFRAVAAGLGMGMGGAGAYIQTHELRGTTELALTPTFSE